MAEISFPLAPKDAPEPPESGFAEVALTPPAPAPVNVAVVTGAIAPDLTTPPPAPSAPERGLAEIVSDPYSSNDLRGRTEERIKNMEETTERKRAKRFHADTPFVLSLLLVLIASMAAASFYISFSGLYAAAEWAVGPNPPLQFAVPIMLDISIIAFTLALFIERERGEKVTGTWLAIGAFTAVSLVANVLHTFVVSTAEDQYQLIIGAVISGGAPLLLAFAVDKIAVKVFKSADKVEPVKKK